MKELILFFTPFGLLSAVVWSLDATNWMPLYWLGFLLFSITLALAGYGLIELDKKFKN